MAPWAQSSEQPCHPQESRANQGPVTGSRDQPRPIRKSRGRAGATEAVPLADLRPTLDSVSSGPWHHTELTSLNSRGQHLQAVTSDQWGETETQEPTVRDKVSDSLTHTRKDKGTNLTFYKLILLINLLRCQWSLLKYLEPFWWENKRRGFFFVTWDVRKF